VRRHQFEHIIRACAEIAADDDIVVVGSQAVLGEHPDAPSTLLASVDADVYPRNHPERADVIEGAIGEGSPFHETFGYYAHGVGPETAKAPRGWEERLVPVRNANTRGATGWCIATPDLVLAKCVAGRAKDWAFAEDAIRHGLVDAAVLRAGLQALALPVEGLEALARDLEGLVARAGRRADAPQSVRRPTARPSRPRARAPRPPSPRAARARPR
jgi:hypothetical protein